MLSMFQRFMSGCNVWMRKNMSSNPSPIPKLLKSDSCDTSQKENFLFDINFHPKIIWLYNTVCKAQANRNSWVKVFISNETFCFRSWWSAKFLPSLLSSSNSHPPSCVKFNYSSPLYLWHFKASTSAMGRAEYHINVCINEIHIKTIS